jgi:probable addiction module antidote protein
LGNFGDCKSVGGRVEELRIDFGPGYRVYFAREGPSVVILLCGRRKGTQGRDLLRARSDMGRSTWMPRLTVKTEPYRESLLESLRNPDEAAQYLNACLEDEDPHVFLLALRDVADAHGGIRTLSQTAKLNRESLYRMLSKTGNPSLDSLVAVLNACGMRLAVQSTHPRRPKRRIA